MKTQVIMKRELFGKEIAQQSQTEYFSATDLLKAGNHWRALNGLPIMQLQHWFNRDTTKEFIALLEEELGKKVKIAKKGRGAITWVHPFLFIKLALSINTALEIKVISWIYDELLKYRNDSGDSYRKMTGYLYQNAKNKSTFHVSIMSTARDIKLACKVKDWQLASEEQLRLRDKMHENIALLSDVLKDNVQAVRLGIQKAIE